MSNHKELDKLSNSLSMFLMWNTIQSLILKITFWNTYQHGKMSEKGRLQNYRLIQIKQIHTHTCIL